jgi:hypothetical protein
MHYTSMACNQSAADFGAKLLNNYHLKSKCPLGQPMKGVYGIDCVNALTAGFVSGSVFSATVCCGVPQRPHAAIEFHSDQGHGHGHNHTAHGAGIRLREVRCGWKQPRKVSSAQNLAQYFADTNSPPQTNTGAATRAR